MIIEEKVFSRLRFSTKALADYGFVNMDVCYSLSRNFMDGDFTAEIRVYENGRVQGRVIDNMTEEEYTPLRMPNYNGAFVGSVRQAYEELLRDIAANCCIEVAFASDQANRIASAILERYSVEPDFPWDDGRYSAAGVFRHSNNNKWFGLLMNIDRKLLDKSAQKGIIDVMNLKADESKVPVLHKVKGIYPAYHMNHSKWISVTLDDTLADSDVMDLVDESFRLTDSPAGVLNEKLIAEVLSVADSIPPGKVMSYGQIAEAVGRPKNSRLVGKIMSLQDTEGDHPCHRVVNQAGRTVPGWTNQRAMLEAEGVEFKENGNVDMSRFRYIMEKSGNSDN